LVSIFEDTVYLSAYLCHYNRALASDTIPLSYIIR